MNKNIKFMWNCSW